MEKIIKLAPSYKDYLWGGTKLREDYGKSSTCEKVAESWEISCHPDGPSFIAEGEQEGMPLEDYIAEHREAILGEQGSRYASFPILCKFIDAKQKLSIQVHPDDAYAKEHENGSFGKTECWYIMDAPENATLVIGHNAKTKEELASMIHEGRWSEFIREIPVKKGDFIQIDPGTVHAIKGGLLILETQQNSDITYRVYDYDRLQNGRPRELHIEKSLSLIHISEPTRH